MKDTITLLRDYQTDYLAIMGEIVDETRLISTLRACPNSTDVVNGLTTHMEGLCGQLDKLERVFVEKLNMQILANDLLEREAK